MGDQIDWEYRLWLNEDIEKLLQRNGMDVKDIPFSYVEDFNRVGFIADLARWCALYEEGGLYLDTDVFVVGDGAQHDLLTRDIVSLPEEKIGSRAYTNAVIWSPRPQDEIVKLIITKIIENFKMKDVLGNPVQECGPLFITNHLRDVGMEIGNLPLEKYVCFDWPSGCQGGRDTVCLLM